MTKLSFTYWIKQYKSWKNNLWNLTGQKIHASVFHRLVDWNNAKFLVNLSALSLKSGHLAKLQKNQNCLAWRTPQHRSPKWQWIIDPKVIWNRSDIPTLEYVQFLDFKFLISMYFGETRPLSNFLMLIGVHIPRKSLAPFCSAVVVKGWL